MNKNTRFALVIATIGFAVVLWTVVLSAVESQQAAAPKKAQGEEPKKQPAAKGQAVADSVMAQWKLKNPGKVADWIAEEKERHKIQSPADNSAVLKEGQGTGHSYGRYTEVDITTWARETEKLVVEGSRIFHDGEALGSTVGVSCDMCHPDGANTHPETYPKFQAQMGRVALLRDMINWCIINPVRGQAFAPDDARMRALEAYIYAQRKGTTLNYGKH